MATRLKPRITKVALVDAGANALATIEIYKRATEPPTRKEPTVAQDIQKNLDEITAERDAMQAELKALEEMPPETVAELLGLELAKRDETEEVLKGLPDDVRKRLEDAEARVEKMERASRLERFTKRAGDEYGKVAEAAELGVALEEIERTAPDAYKTLETCLKAANERIEMSTVLKEVGSAGSDSEPMAKVRARADEIRKADPTVSETEAMSKAMAESPDAQAAAFTQ